MRIFYALVIATGLLVCGCSSAVDRQYADAVHRLNQINTNQLIVDSQTIIKKLGGRSLYNIPENQWPVTIKDLNPVSVNCDGSGVLIILKRWVSKESGFYIPESGYDPTKNTTVLFRLVQPQLYWYAL